MVKKYPEITHIFNEHMKGGDGTVEVIPSVVQGEYESDANVIARLILKPGCSLGMHEHIGEEEIITVLHGTAEYNDNGESSTVETGDVCICKSGGRHSIANASPSEDLELMAVIRIVHLQESHQYNFFEKVLRCHGVVLNFLKDCPRFTSSKG